MGLFFGKPSTVNEALAPLLKAITDLEAVNDDRLTAARDKSDEADQLKAEAAADREEANRADAVLTKLKALVGADTQE